MMLFWMVAGLLVAGALLFVLPPLFSRQGHKDAATQSESNLSIYRDQLRELDSEHAAGSLDDAQYQSARSELDSRVIEDSSVPDSVVTPVTPGNRWVAVGVALLVPAIAIPLYMMIGSPININPPADMQQSATDEGHAITPEMIMAMVERLEQRLQENPENLEGWMMLARSYTAMGRFSEASVAYASAIALQPDNAHLLADYADALAMANGKTLQGEPEDIIKRALKADPDNIKALALAGSAAFERGAYSEAIVPWKKILTLVPPDSQAAISVNASLDEAQRLSGEPPAVASQERASQAAATGGATVSGTIRLDPAFEGRVAATDTVFIFARHADGRRGPPLAITRKTGKDFPISFTLDDSMAMMPAFNLSSVAQVVVGARISKAGNANPQLGDLEGFSAPVNVGAKDISFAITSELK